MKKIISAVLLSSTLMAQTFWIEGGKRVNENLQSLSPKAYVNVAEAVSPAVVNIATSFKPKSNVQDLFKFGDPRGRGQNPFEDFFEKFFEQMPQNPQGGQQQKSLGSGFLINKDGYVVTNNHVVDKADEIKVILQDKNEYPAVVVGKDPKTDLALIKIQTQKPLPVVPLGNSDQMKVGDIVVAIGNPFGLSHTTTQGIISAKERSIGFGNYDDFIQTDASINPGNSGGPLLNIYGEVIGINSAIIASAQGIGFAIPVNLAKDILLKLKNTGSVERGFLGVMVQPITQDHAKVLKLKNKEGALVSDVVKNGPGAKAGLKAGDVIIEFNGKPIKDMHQLPLFVANAPVGKPAKVVFVRNGKLQTLMVTLEVLKDDKEDQRATFEKTSQKDILGFGVQTLTPSLAKTLGLEETQKGVVIQDIDSSSVAYEKEIRPGDVVVEINQRSIVTIEDYDQVVKKIRPKDSVLLLIKRRDASMYVAFTLGEKKTP